MGTAVVAAEGISPVRDTMTSGSKSDAHPRGSRLCTAVGVVVAMGTVWNAYHAFEIWDTILPDTVRFQLLAGVAVSAATSLAWFHMGFGLSRRRKDLL
jgi:hypothetical protein